MAVMFSTGNPESLKGSGAMLFVSLIAAAVKRQETRSRCNSDSGMGDMGFLGGPVFGRLFHRTLAWEQTPGVLTRVDWVL
jgi:hypothetical protein